MYSTKCANQMISIKLHMNIKDVPQTCIGRKVLPTGSTVSQVQNQLLMKNYYLQGSTFCNNLRCWHQWRITRTNWTTVVKTYS